MLMRYAQQAKIKLENQREKKNRQDGCPTRSGKERDQIEKDRELDSRTEAGGLIKIPFSVCEGQQWWGEPFRWKEMEQFFPP